MHYAANGAEALPNWIPEAVIRYLAHTEGGATIRSLARDGSCHASTVLRQIRSVENARDDVLVDEALISLARAKSKSIKRLVSRDAKSIEISSEIKSVGRKQSADERQISAARTGGNTTDPQATEPGFIPDDAAEIPDLNRDAPPILRRLAQPGAMLAVAADMDKAVIVRDTGSGDAQRIGIVDRPLARAMALTRWITCETPGRIARYRITASGRDALKSLIARAENRALGFHEAPNILAGQKDHLGTTNGGTVRPRRRAGLVDTPVLGLARRRDHDGTAFLSHDLVRAAERIQDDFELAHMDPQIALDWDQFLAVSPDHIEPQAPMPQNALRGSAAARARVQSALADLGPGLGHIVLECCCRMQGLETAERNLGWSARSGKIVLRIALQRLKRHFDELGDGGGLIG